MENSNSTINCDGHTAVTTTFVGQNKTKRRKKEDASDVVMQLIAETLKNDKPMSVNQSFATYITRQLDEVHDTKMVLIAKKLMTDILFEAQMGTLTPNTKICNTQVNNIYSISPGPSSSSSYNSFVDTNPGNMQYINTSPDVGGQSTATVLTASDFIKTFTYP